MQSPDARIVQMVKEGKSPREVAALLGCSLKTARERMRDASALLSSRSRCVDQADQILRHSGLGRPEIAQRGGYREVNRWRAWQDVALGLKRAA